MLTIIKKLLSFKFFGEKTLKTKGPQKVPGKETSVTFKLKENVFEIKKKKIQNAVR